jgi:hypothetical protein
MRQLSTFSSCGWAYGFTLTPLPPQRLPQIQEILLYRSGQSDMAGNYKKALEARKLLNVKNMHSDRYLLRGPQIFWKK